MIIVPGRPPNFDSILAKMPDADKYGVIFAYGDQIFNPSGIEIPAALLAHEEVHGRRQLAMIPPASWIVHEDARVNRHTEEWWDRYLTDPQFRYEEELLAHVAEYKVCAQRVTDRNQRARLLLSTARRLIAPLYNYDPPRSLIQAANDLSTEINR